MSKFKFDVDVITYMDAVTFSYASPKLFALCFSVEPSYNASIKSSTSLDISTRV